LNADKLKKLQEKFDHVKSMNVNSIEQNPVVEYVEVERYKDKFTLEN